jgi:hypothetical protein
VIVLELVMSLALVMKKVQGDDLLLALKEKIASISFTTLQMFCLLNPQMNACEPNPKTTSSDFNR